MSVTESGILPDFIVIGAMKSGTTSLYRSLAAHPDIGMSRDKETDFFLAERQFSRGIAWYSAQFKPGFALHGEASPNYSKVDDFKGVPERIRRHVPDVKLIYVVRDPVARFVSQYRHSWTIGDIAMSPDELPKTAEYRHILSVSKYARQLEAYLEHFPRERILIVDFDALSGDLTSAMDEVHAFIGARPFSPDDLGSFNDNAEISRVPAPLLRLAQSRFGRALNHVVGRDTRDRIRELLAFGKSRQPPPFSPTLLGRIEDDLRADAEAFRRLAGRPFSSWSI